MHNRKNKKALLSIQCLFIFISIAFFSSAQNQENVWVFGDSAGLDFNSGSPIAITGTSLDADEPSASICDASGQLLFYVGSIGVSFIAEVWTPNHALMMNGDSLMGSFTHTNGILILPSPSDSNFYFIFTIDLEMVGKNSLYYSTVDMNADSGRGAVIQKNILLSSNCLTEKLAAIRHGNGRSWWILVHGYNLGQGFTSGHSKTFYEYSLDNSGVNFADSFLIGSDYIDSIPGDGFGLTGQMIFSKNGSKLGAVGFGIIDVFDFDRCTGNIYNWINLSPSIAGWPYDNYYGASFSPDETKFYVSRWGSNMNVWGGELFQYDLLAPNVLSTKTQIFSTNGRPYVFPGQHQLGPDDKIYIATEYYNYQTFEEWDSTDMSLSVINDPDSLGLSCNYSPYSVTLGGRKCKLGLPNMPNYNLSALQCDSANSIDKNEVLKIAALPNPSFGLFKINYSSIGDAKSNVIIYDAFGKEIKQVSLPAGSTSVDINLSDFNNGIYFCHLIENGSIQQTEKLMLIK